MRIILALLLILLPTQGWCVTQWAKSSLPAVGDNLTLWPTQVNAQWAILDTLLSNYRRGYTLGYSSGSTLTASAGEVVVSNAAGTARIFLQNSGSSNITFSNIDTGAEASSTTYYVYCGTSTATDAACTFYVSLSSSAPTGVTYYARLGSFVNDGSSNITAISNDNYIGGFGSKSTKTFGTTYQALTDGIVEGYGHQTSGGSPTMVCYTDSLSTPTTVAISIYTDNRVNDTTAYSFTVAKGDYYRCPTLPYWTNDAFSFRPTGN